MSSQTSKSRHSLLYRLLNGAVHAIVTVVRAGDQVMLHTAAHFRQAVLHPLKPFPLAHVAGGALGGVATQAISAQETQMMREHHHPLGIAGLPSPTLQHAHAFLKLLPVWLPMPETRRHGHGQVALEWSGDGGSRLSVLIGHDGMMIYSARLGVRGRLDGAEPIGEHLSPILTHVIRQLNA